MPQERARPSTHAASRVTRILIVDDHPMLRRGLAELISHEPDMGTCGEADDADSAMEQVRSARPDLAIIDIALRNSNGLELVKQLHASHPGLRILVCSMHDETLFAERSLRAGAMGYVNKEQALDAVVGAIRAVLAGKVYLSGAMAERILHRVRNGGGALEESPVQRLTDRELEVFELLGHGLGTAEIAGRLHLSAKTIDAHRQKIKRKLGIGSSGELVQQAVTWVLDRMAGA